MIITTTPSVEGYQIADYRGIVVGEAQYDLPEGSPVRWLSDRIHRAALAGLHEPLRIAVELPRRCVT